MWQLQQRKQKGVAQEQTGDALWGKRTEGGCLFRCDLTPNRNSPKRILEFSNELKSRVVEALGRKTKELHNVFSTRQYQTRRRPITKLGSLARGTWGNLQPFAWVGSADFLLSDFWLGETSLLTRKELYLNGQFCPPGGKKKKKFKKTEKKNRTLKTEPCELVTDKRKGTLEFQ